MKNVQIVYEQNKTVDTMFLYQDNKLIKCVKERSITGRAKLLIHVATLVKSNHLSLIYDVKKFKSSSNKDVYEICYDDKGNLWDISICGKSFEEFFDCSMEYVEKSIIYNISNKLIKHTTIYFKEV